ncbi:MAG: response regulator [Actinobacteria bacterium]|nr:response regulator [Actinomycetota bacterium]
MNIRVVLGEDNMLVREGVRALLDASDGVEVVGVAADAPALLAIADETTPDVVVTDIKMPPLFQLEGIEAAHEIRRRHPGTGVVVLSAHDDEAYALALLGGGESGLAYLLKERVAEGDELVRAIKEVAAGASAIDPVIAARLSDRGDRRDEDREVLDLMAQGLGYADMAERLGTEIEATVLFSDIRGFSSLSEHLPAKELASVMSRHLAAMAEVVLAHGGTVDKFAGDAVMAVFGAPDPLPDHAARALRCGLAMQARQAELNAEGAAEGRAALGMGVGVNTGTVIAGTVGGGGRLEYTVLGDAVNVAQRLQSEAAAGEVLASEETVSRASGVRAEAVGPRAVKGRTGMVEVCRVIEIEREEDP